MFEKKLIMAYLIYEYFMDHLIYLIILIIQSKYFQNINLLFNLSIP